MAVDFSSLAPNTPIVVGAGQSVERDVGTTSHLGMAAQAAAQIRDAEPLTQLYTERMIAQDSVNQGAALLLTSVARARELGIPEDRRVFMHGATQGTDHTRQPPRVTKSGSTFIKPF